MLKNTYNHGKTCLFEKIPCSKGRVEVFTVVARVDQKLCTSGREKRASDAAAHDDAACSIPSTGPSFFPNHEELPHPDCSATYMCTRDRWR